MGAVVVHKATVVIPNDVGEDLADLPLPIQARVTKLLERLRDWPGVSGARPLTGNLAGKYRSRTGDYRVQFRVETTRTVEPTAAPTKGPKRAKPQERVVFSHKVIIEKVGHRDGFYDGQTADAIQQCFMEGNDICRLIILFLRKPVAHGQHVLRHTAKVGSAQVDEALDEQARAFVGQTGRPSCLTSIDPVPQHRSGASRARAAQPSGSCASPAGCRSRTRSSCSTRAPG